MLIRQKLQEAKKYIYLLQHSDEMIMEEKLDLLEELEKLIGENPSTIKFQSILLYNNGYIDQARLYLEECLKKYQKSFTLLSLGVEFNKYSPNNIKDTFYYLACMYKFTNNIEIQNQVLKQIEDYVLETKISQQTFKEYFERFKLDIDIGDYRSYPLDEYGNSIIRKEAFPGRDQDNSYLVNMYKTVYGNNIDANNRFFFLYEMIKGKFVGKSSTLLGEKGDIIAISSAKSEVENTNIHFLNLEEQSVEINLEPNNIRYFKVRDSKEIIIESEKDIFVSHFKKNKLKDKPKLVLQIFLDGLSNEFLNINNISELMPNTYQFFKTGYINNNCHANGEWTLPSLMSMCTGKYTTNHFIYHTDYPHKGEENNKMIQEYFQEEGYMTGRICANWRGTPSYGYFKGTNRSVYSPMMERMYCNEVVAEALEHLESFKDFHNYLWITIEDLHAVADGLSKGLLHDINLNEYNSERSEDDSEISVFRNYNIKKIEEYKSMMKKVDFYLGILFKYINENYNNDEFVITLNSDHGQGFTEKEDYLFQKGRTNVPFMMKGKNVPNLISNELMSNVDIVPTVLGLCSIDINRKIDGMLLKDLGGTERQYTITESIFPGQTYKLAINDKEHLLRFESKQEVFIDGRINLEEYEIKLINCTTKEDETNKYQDKISAYHSIIFDHIKEWIYFED